MRELNHRPNICEVSTDKDILTDENRAFSSDLVDTATLIKDVEIPAGTPLFFITIIRRRESSRFGRDLRLIEEGLALTPHLDGFIRVGHMCISFYDKGEGNALTNLLWGDGKETTICVYQYSPFEDLTSKPVNDS